MTTAKKVSRIIGLSMAVGAILGVLYAPSEGAKTRRKIYNFKRKLMCAQDNDDRKALEDLSDELKQQLKLVNERLDELG